MADYQIVCVRKSARTPAGHQHIVSVGIGSGGTYTSLLSVADVYQMMRNGNRFYTVSPSTGAVAWVRALTCCGLYTLTTSPDHVTDNNLDNLSYCGN
ncbi:MAG: hypothetical protein QOD07_593 [Frankiaceae bacterium]|jgi:hypothetical protein|nr:hypothetical protein [Frankiaceae bacterium]